MKQHGFARDYPWTVVDKGDDRVSLTLTENEEKMFLANLFTIKSIGITYITSITEVVSLLTWDSTSEFRYWDKGRWTL